jgi:hypothetical protein
MKVRQIKPKGKITELNKSPEKLVEQIIINKSEKETIESKTKTAALPLLKKSAPAQQPAARQQQSREPAKDKEHIFVSYDRFGMSEAEKRRVYSLDIRGSAPARPTGTIEHGTQDALAQERRDEMKLERPGELARVNPMDEPALAMNEEMAKYKESPSERYKHHRQTDFY